MTYLSRQLTPEALLENANAVAALPPEERAKLAGMRAKLTAASAELRRTGQRDTS